MSFTDWLKDQEKREDPIGDLARDAKVDKNFPYNGTLSEYRNVLHLAGACSDAIIALNAAWSEYSGEPVEIEDEEDEIDEP